mmetsp:Transcript_21053/g.65848  ORF Transcript_21053/g.65848 Transcript_21053/m.65848 type:complete len:89 (+) Transcript_21053:1-267(+)
MAAYALEGLGEARTYLLGLTVSVVGLFAIASGALLQAHAAVGFWTGLTIVGLGFGFQSRPFARSLGGVPARGSTALSSRPRCSWRTWA